jgi:hypothetical protein
VRGGDKGMRGSRTVWTPFFFDFTLESIIIALAIERGIRLSDGVGDTAQERAKSRPLTSPISRVFKLVSRDNQKTKISTF